MGPTGSGKTTIAEGLADAFDARLLNADAFQVYRGMDIGTNTPVDKSRYSLLDLVEPTEDFGVGEWVRLAQNELQECWARKQSVVVVGGTGLYVRALFEEYADMREPPAPDLRASLMEREQRDGVQGLVRELMEIDPSTTVDLKNPVRVRRALERHLSKSSLISVRLPAFRKFKIATFPDAVALEAGLKKRVSAMLDAGWPEEIRNLLQKGVPLSAPGFRAIGYQSVAGFLSGKSSRATTEEDVFRATRQYAKRQKTWLRSEPNLTGLPVTSLDDEGMRQALNGALSIVSGRGDK
jgi:tRNA dimethylallyltransferase